MATNIERLQAIGDALLDGTATTQQLQRVADAFIDHYNVSDALTNEQKAGVVIHYLKRHIREILRTGDNGIDAARQALEDKRDECHAEVNAAEEDLSAAIVAANNQAGADWPDE